MGTLGLNNNHHTRKDVQGKKGTVPVLSSSSKSAPKQLFNPYPTAFPYGNGMVLHFYQQQESSTTKTEHKVINKGLKAYVRGLLEKYSTVFFYANT